MSASTRFVRAVWRDFQRTKGHDANSFGHMVVKDAKPGKVWCEMKVESHQVNRLQGLHGGLIASLVDTMGSLALASRGMFMTGQAEKGSTGLSRKSHSYVRGAALGEDIRVRSELSAKTGKLLAYGSHTKYIADALKSQKNVKFDTEGETVVEGEEPKE
ncbi:hypothetical protein JCM8547_003997 [Rhodosporidiobolus lusitaniae]